MPDERSDEAWRADMQRLVLRMWWVVFAVTVLFWVVFPWQIGLAGVGPCIFLTLMLVLTRFFMWLGKSGIIRQG